MYQALRSLDVPTELVIYPGQFHGFTRPSFIRDRYERYFAWYDKYLMPKAGGEIGISGRLWTKKDSSLEKSLAVRIFGLSALAGVHLCSAYSRKFLRHSKACCVRDRSLIQAVAKLVGLAVSEHR